MAATTLWAPTLVFATLPMSWDLMGNSVTVSLNVITPAKPFAWLIEAMELYRFFPLTEPLISL